jgi:beta-N-acetylhexosaminidase
MTATAFVTGCATTSLSRRERAFYRAADPWGLILFQRNCNAPSQVRQLTDDFRECVGRGDAPVFIDQEGGRVQRLKPPHWRAYPSGAQLGSLAAKDRDAGIRAAGNCTRLIADDLYALGITVDCLPVLDVPQPGSHHVIGDRAYGSTPEIVGALGRAAADGLLAGGVLPVIKHIPGHGRANADSHMELPQVDATAGQLAAHDFAPFHALRTYPIAMTAHVIYSSLDRDRPATQSEIIVNDVVRRQLGFDGLLITDDLNMNALSGTLGERAAASYEAGCDMVLHCNGNLEQIEKVAQEAPQILGKCAERATAALAMLAQPREYDVDEALQDLDRALGESV